MNMKIDPPIIFLNFYELYYFLRWLLISSSIHLSVTVTCASYYKMSNKRWDSRSSKSSDSTVLQRAVTPSKVFGHYNLALFNAHIVLQLILRFLLLNIPIHIKVSSPWGMISWLYGSIFSKRSTRPIALHDILLISFIIINLMSISKFIVTPHIIGKSHTLLKGFLHNGHIYKYLSHLSMILPDDWETISNSIKLLLTYWDREYRNLKIEYFSRSWHIFSSPIHLTINTSLTSRHPNVPF